MNISIYQKSVFEKYHSKSQIARVLTEHWVEQNMYCPCCLNNEMIKNPNNTKVVDFYCENCLNCFQLKSQTTHFGLKILDGAYRTMVESMLDNSNPNFMLMYYSGMEWNINSLFVIPKFFFSESIIEKRKPLSSTARRAGWVGCNILLGKLPFLGRIYVINNQKILPKKSVKENWKRISFMNTQILEKRAWINDILSCIEKLNKREFNLPDLYYFEEQLSIVHPHNKNIKPKIRQQLQILRDRGILKFKGNGKYSLQKF